MRNGTRCVLQFLCFSALVDEVSGEVRQLTANKTELRSGNVELIAHVAALESLVISKDEKLTVMTENLR